MPNNPTSDNDAALDHTPHNVDETHNEQVITGHDPYGQTIMPTPGAPVDLNDYETSYVGRYRWRLLRNELYDLRKRIYRLQEMLHAQKAFSLLIVFQAMDGAGKDSMVKQVVDTLNPMQVKIAHFRKPSAEEAQYDFLWRVHRAVPPKGYIGFFNRSHYEDVLVTRVNDLEPEGIWRPRYQHINNFEHMLVDSGTCILKFFLHISKDEQKKRFQARLDNPSKHWKFSQDDFSVREQWDAYMQAYSDAITHTNTELAPWHIVPADTKWYRNYIIFRTIAQALEGLPLAFPEPAVDVDDLYIPD